jgi:hypothetical protein
MTGSVDRIGRSIADTLSLRLAAPMVAAGSRWHH